jgi:hypothetical protein
MTTTEPAIGWAHELAEQLDWHWRTFVRPRLDGLQDAEYFWEPVAGCWSIRHRALSTVAHTLGTGDFVLEHPRRAPQPPPLTTIAWRLAHLAVGVFGRRASSHFGYRDGGLSDETADYPGTAAGALAFLDAGYQAWLGGVRGLDADGLRAPVGPAEGPFADAPMAALVLHINREALHHGAELLLLRDLYRTSDGGRVFTTVQPRTIEPMSREATDE